LLVWGGTCIALKFGEYRESMEKATEAYGTTIARDLSKAIERMQNRQGPNPCPKPDDSLDVNIDVYKMTIFKHFYLHA